MTEVPRDKETYRINCGHPTKFRVIIHTIFHSGLNIVWCKFCGAMKEQADFEGPNHVDKWHHPTISGGPIPTIRAWKGKDVAYKTCIHCCCREKSRLTKKACPSGKGHEFIFPQKTKDFVRFLGNLSSAKFQPVTQMRGQTSAANYRRILRDDEKDSG